MTALIPHFAGHDCREIECEMGDWRVALKYERKEVNRAGKVITGDLASEVVPGADEIVNNWRAAHGIPLNAIQVDLRKSARRIDSRALLVQRLKRFRSIKEKLQRTTLTLTQMQDIGGCRAVLWGEKRARELYNRYLGSQRIQQHLWGRNDYVTEPASSGYRGFHLKYEYHTDREELALYNGMRVEIQLRSRLQHIWATAVEIVGTMRDEPMKSSIGDQDWLRFFQLMGSVMAEREGTSPVPDTPKDHDELIQELRHYENKLSATNYLVGCMVGMDVPSDPKRRRKNHIYIMELDKAKRRTTVRVFTTQQIRRAIAEYRQLELDISSNGDDPNKDVVLVAADSVAALKRAYPNYHLDTRLFVDVMQRTLA